MPRRRRRLMLSSFSDNEDEEEKQQENLNPNLTHTPPNPNPNPNFPESLPIFSSEEDDDEFIDVSDNLSPPEPVSNHTSPQPQFVAPVSSRDSSGCPVADFLFKMGLRLKREWLDSCLRRIESSIGAQDRNVAVKAKHCFEQFLFSDMNYCSIGVLPPNVDSLHLVDLPGPFVLQVDEIVNISCPLRGRYQDAPPGVKRCLKLSMTDGVQRVFGMEYRPIKDLKVLAPAGLKVAICNVHIRHGLLMLVPEALEVLGGMVEELDAARQRLVEEVNKPPRGRRSRTGVVPPLATRATLAAWPSNGTSVPGNRNSSANILGHVNGSANVSRQRNGSLHVLGQTAGSVNVLGETNNSTLQGAANVFGCTNSAVNVVGETNNSTLQGATPFHAEVQENTMSYPSSGVVPNVEEMHIEAPSVGMTDTVSNQHSTAISDHEDVSMVDEVEHPLILSGDQEIPFTYLASLLARWAAVKEKVPSVQGKVKCFLTGVKGFQYKQRITYELQVYVDDGSLISEILVDHNVVQKGIGHSPEEVTAALSSSDTKRVNDMKETLRQFQIFLVNFEGMMLIEVSGTSCLPVALELSQGCPASDARLLMRRLKSFAPAQTPQQPSLDPIDISP